MSKDSQDDDDEDDDERPSSSSLNDAGADAHVSFASENADRRSSKRQKTRRSSERMGKSSKKKMSSSSSTPKRKRGEEEVEVVEGGGLGDNDVEVVSVTPGVVNKVKLLKDKKKIHSAQPRTKSMQAAHRKMGRITGFLPLPKGRPPKEKQDAPLQLPPTKGAAPKAKKSIALKPKATIVGAVVSAGKSKRGSYKNWDTAVGEMIASIENTVADIGEGDCAAVTCAAATAV
eukprot:CAMPEP_0172329080 /NCGR_PEP_ID=MMETSP1058-20130122/60690_1 /TAXON_ID=83371 /ORGANISM="Detonula confervacea, Strain CCMP 353" /LENGTH=230 /DNA_ID=CAMNT_0013046229 /DNA_START=163 /DNA_END=856 /DNA_ORIENTATION=-